MAAVLLSSSAVFLLSPKKSPINSFSSPPDGSSFPYSPIPSSHSASTSCPRYRVPGRVGSVKGGALGEGSGSASDGDQTVYQGVYGPWAVEPSDVREDRENRELEATLLMYQSLMGKSLESVWIEEITSLAWLIEMKVNEVKRRVEGYKGVDSVKPKKDVAVVKEEKGVEVEELQTANEKSAMELAMEELQRQEWFTEIMNPPPPPPTREIGGYPYGEHGSNAGNGNNNPWMNAYFPLN